MTGEIENGKKRYTIKMRLDIYMKNMKANKVAKPTTEAKTTHGNE